MRLEDKIIKTLAETPYEYEGSECFKHVEFEHDGIGCRAHCSFDWHEETNDVVLDGHSYYCDTERVADHLEEIKLDCWDINTDEAIKVDIYYIGRNI